MINIFKRKAEEEPIYLDCYTASHYAYNHAKIDYSRRYFPEWFKEMAENVPVLGGTIKHCTAFKDYYAKGIVIPLWGEVEITVHPIDSEGGAFTWSSSNADFDLHSQCHPREQWEGFGSKNLHNVKFMSPWAFKTREFVNFTWGQPTWSQPETFNGLTGLPAVVQFKSQSFTEINYMVEQKEEAQRFNLQPLTPMAMLHPMTERKVEIRNHLVSTDKMAKILHRGGGMLLNSNEGQEHDKASRLHSRKRKFWAKADELNKCPFK